MQDMDDEQGAAVDETTADRMRSKDKPRGKCTGCAFDYQLGTARTGEHKGKLVIRKHNSRTGPGLCSGAQQPPYDEQDCACGGAGADDGCPNCSVAGSGDVPLTEIRLPVGPRPDVVGVAPGGLPIVATPLNADGSPAGEPFDAVGAITLGTRPVDPFTAPLPSMDEIRGALVGAAGLTGYADHVVSEIQSGRDPFTEQQKQDAALVAGIFGNTLPPVPVPDQWTPTGTVLDRMTPEQRTEALGVLGRQHAEYPPSVIHPAPDPWSAPAPASLIPESTTTVSGQPEPDRDRWGRYLIMGTAHTRATTFAKLGANTKAIEAWNERNVIRGLTLRPDLLMLANGLEVKRDRNDLNSIAAQAKDAAGSKVAANIGTAYHAFSERLDAGLMSLDQVPEQYRNRVRQYGVEVARAGLSTRPEWIERTTAVRADQIGAPLPVAGTLDRIFQLPDGSLVIGDLKTGSDLSYGEMEIEVQLALYAHGVNTHGLFDWNTKTWQGTTQDDPAHGVRVRTDIAIVIHLPADGDGCTLYVADIERGWRDAQRLGPLQASLKEKKRFRTLTAADLAPRPAPVEQGEVAQYLAAQPAPVIEPFPSPEQVDADDTWERAKRMFSEASSQADVASLYQFAMDSGRFHKNQLAVLVGLGKDRLNELARG